MKGVATVRFPWSSEAGRPEDEKTLDTFLQEAAEAGYDAVEHVCDGIEAGLERYGLQLSGGYASFAAHERWENLDLEDAVMADARRTAELGGDHMSINCDPKGSWSNRERKTEDELKRQGENLSKLADILDELGLALNMHNHANRLDLHLDDIKSVTQFADDSVGICLDTGWTLTSGDAPLSRLHDLGERVRGLHLRNQVDDQPTEWLGQGQMDIGLFLAELNAQGYDGWLTTELWHREDVPRTMSLVEDQRRSVELLRNLWEAC